MFMRNMLSRISNHNGKTQERKMTGKKKKKKDINEDE